MKKKVLNLISILIVMLFIGCGSNPKGTELTTQNLWTEHEIIDYEQNTEIVKDDKLSQQKETSQLESSVTEENIQDKDIELYVNILRNYVLEGKNDFTVSFIDLDDDDTRDLVVFFGESQADGAFLFTIKNEKAVQIVAEGEDSFGQYGGFTYKDKGNIFVSENESVTTNQISDEIIYYEMEEGKQSAKI